MPTNLENLQTAITGFYGALAAKLSTRRLISDSYSRTETDAQHWRIASLAGGAHPNGMTYRKAGWIMRDGSLRLSGESWRGSNAHGTSQPWLGQPATVMLPAGHGKITQAILNTLGPSLALDDSGNVYGWGTGAYGGNGSVSGDVYVATKLNISGLNVGEKITALETSGNGYLDSDAAGGIASAYLRSDANRLWACGYNAFGQLGLSDTNNRFVPVLVTALTGIAAVSAAGGQYGHALALTTGGSVKAWGYNAQGQLGIGSTVNASSPQSVSLPSAASKVLAQRYCSYALLANGDVYAWGYNAYGQLGVGDTTQRTSPVKITALSGVADIWCGGGDHGVLYAKKATGELYACGYNGYGQLGVGDTTQRNTPVLLYASGQAQAVQIAVGGHLSYGWLALLDTSGALWSCGYNGNGQLGHGDTSTRNSLTRVPVALPPGVSISAIRTAGYSTEGALHLLLSDGSALACGYNGAGALGVGASDQQARYLLSRVAI